MAQRHVNCVVLTLFCAICALITNSSSSECKAGIKHQPPQQLSLCTKGYSKETKVSLLPHVNCTCRLVIPIQNRIRIIAKQDPEQSGSSENEAFVIAQESFRYTPTLYKTGSCQEYGSSTQHLSYTISYIQQVKKTKTNLQLWLEAFPDMNNEKIIKSFSLHCGDLVMDANKGAAKMFATTMYWTSVAPQGIITNSVPTRTAGSSASHRTTKPSGLTTMPLSGKPSGSRMTGQPLATASVSLTSSVSPVDSVSLTASVSPTGSVSPTMSSMATKNVSSVPSTSGSFASYWDELSRNKKFLLAISLSLGIMVLIMILTGAISYLLFIKKKRHRTGSQRRILKRSHDKYGNDVSDDDVHSDYHGVFQVTGTSASDVRFQY